MRWPPALVEEEVRPLASAHNKRRAVVVGEVVFVRAVYRLSPRVAIGRKTVAAAGLTRAHVVEQRVEAVNRIVVVVANPKERILQLSDCAVGELLRDVHELGVAHGERGVRGIPAAPMKRARERERDDFVNFCCLSEQ